MAQSANLQTGKLSSVRAVKLFNIGQVLNV
ncbi:MAG: hypothetical protein RI927_469, partial [Actinomycetota bacterium]